jgi:uncharacterized protein (DUF2147 family)
MRAKSWITFLALVPLLLSASAWSAAPQSPVGLWQGTDPDSKQPTGWFLISEHDGIYAGVIAKMFLKPNEDPKAVCDHCKDDRHNHPWLGLEILRGMKPDGENKFTGGTILDPRDGNIYSAIMTLAPDGQTLIVRGYLGIKLLGRDEHWTRLPDSAFSMLDPSVSPNPAVNPTPGPAVNPPVNPPHH